MKKLFKNIWFWLLVVGICLLVGNILVLFLIKDNDLQSAWLTLISGWVSGISTIVLGVIAVIQNRKYKKENDSVLKEQTNFAWKSNYAEMYRRYVKQICEHWAAMEKYYPQKVVKTFLDGLAQNSFNEYNLLTGEFEGDFAHFAVRLRKTIILNDAHK